MQTLALSSVFMESTLQDSPFNLLLTSHTIYATRALADTRYDVCVLVLLNARPQPSILRRGHFRHQRESIQLSLPAMTREMSHSSSEKQKPSRKSHRKSRNGCDNCKRRRIKVCSSADVWSCKLNDIDENSVQRSEASMLKLYQALRLLQLLATTCAFYIQPKICHESRWTIFSQSFITVYQSCLHTSFCFNLLRFHRPFFAGSLHSACVLNTRYGVTSQL
jgi:hypothetical protein